MNSMPLEMPLPSEMEIPTRWYWRTRKSRKI